MRRRRELCCTVSRKLLNAEKDERFNHQIIHPCNSNVFYLVTMCGDSSSDEADIIYYYNTISVRVSSCFGGVSQLSCLFVTKVN